jgi:hypothetical protein
VAGLLGVTALSSRDVWAVGGNESSVSLHWNGSRWTRLRTGEQEALYDVVGITSRDVWAVGGDESLLTIHWNGRRWNPMLGPNVGEQLSWLQSVAAVSANNVWAVGEAQNGLSLREPVVDHWNGRRWNTTFAPHIDGGLTGVAARSANEIWTVGWDDPVLGGAGGTISRWNGQTWHSQEVGSGNDLVAIATDKGTHLWAVGSQGNPTDENDPKTPSPLIERYGC